MAFWIIFLAVATALFFAAMIWLLPKVFLKSKYSFKSSADRGIKKYRLDSGGYAIVYAPHLKTRKYISQYVITEQDGKKQLKCKINKEIFYLEKMLLNEIEDVVGSRMLYQTTNLDAVALYLEHIFKNI